MALPLSTQTWSDEEVLVAYEVLKSGNTTMGQNVEEFEKQFAQFFGSKYAVMVNSGSSANLIAISALTYQRPLNSSKDCEVIVPAVSWSTTYYPVAQLGFKLRFVDVDLNTLNLNFEEVRRAINANTVGIFAVNLLGQPAELFKLKELALENDLFLIEDNCESMGASLNGKFAGTFGDVGTFSFFFSHHINTMEGGICLTNSEELFHFMKSLRAHGWTRGLPDKNYVFDKSGVYWDDHFRFVLPGYNFRPLEISGAIGKVQLRKFPEFLQNRRENLIHFNDLFRDNENIIIQKGEGESSSFAFSLILRNRLHGRRTEVVQELERAGVETRPIVAGDFTKQPVMKYLNFTKGELVNTEIIDQQGFYIGNHHYDIKHELDQVAKIVDRFSK